MANSAVIVSVAQFDPGVNLGHRPGAKWDTRRLHRTLSKLGFKVDVHNDLSSEEIYQLFTQESRRPVRDCFLAVLSSHGDEGCVFGADGKPVYLSRIFGCFDNEHMEPKAKVFLIQACRGEAVDGGVEVDSGGDAAGFSIPQYESVPVDTAVMYATVPDVLRFTRKRGKPEPGADPPDDPALPQCGLRLPGQRSPAGREEGDAVSPEPAHQGRVPLR
ncbi:caspase-3-like isoform X2 [Betta splendens]|uniref:Caspase-3-like isoform X2 n=1 Tax=Betta splendens TaxID=158456 RepID=A0A6P7P197_BETSP|nr:caspase-3-like isoform X2 [Betta splendens]